MFKDFLDTKPNIQERISPITIKKWIDKYCEYYQIPHNHYKSNGSVYVELNISNINKKTGTLIKVKKELKK